jgi:hypothetical protein
VLLAFMTGCSEPPQAPTSVGLTVTSIQPVTGPSHTEVRIAGNGFRPNATVTIGGVEADVLTVVNSTIVARTRPHSAGPVDVVVTNPGTADRKPAESATLPGAFTYVALAIREVGPNLGFGNLRFWVFGTGFLPGAQVSIGGLSTTVTNSPTSLVGLAPHHAPGPADIVVTNPGGESVTLAGGYTYFPQPTLTAAPTQTTPGAPVTVHWTCPLTSGFEWIGLYRITEGDNTRFVQSRYVAAATSGSVTFAAPLEPGVYEFRFLPLDRYDAVAESEPITVAATSVLAARLGDSARIAHLDDAKRRARIPAAQQR